MQKKRNRFHSSSMRLNQYVELVVFDPEQGKINLSCRFSGTDQDRIFLTWPVDRMGVRYFFSDISFAVFQAVCAGEVVSFKVDITKQALANHDTRVLEIRAPVYYSGMIQKRVYERVSKTIDFRFRYLCEGRFCDYDCTGVTSDLSIGGMEFSSLEKMEKGTEIECFFVLEYVDFSGIYGEIIRRTEKMENGNLEYVYALRFTTMFERDRTTLNQILMKSHHKIPQPVVLQSH